MANSGIKNKTKIQKFSDTWKMTCQECGNTWYQHPPELLRQLYGPNVKWKLAKCACVYDPNDYVPPQHLKDV